MADSRQATHRSDALANRTRIVQVAREAFAADPATSLNSIAKAARVGPGTLYRHFPSREALLVAVYRHEIDELAALASALLREHAPLAAFEQWCDRFAVFGDVKHGVADRLSAALSDQQARDTYRSLLAAMRELLRACGDAGVLRSDVLPEDALALLSTLLRIEPTPDGKEQRQRLITLIVAGLAVPTGDRHTSQREHDLR